MKDFFEVVNNRRSVRKYSDEQLKDEEIEKIIAAGIMAPTAIRLEPWHFTVIQDKDFLDEINCKTIDFMKNSDDEHFKAMAKSNINVMHNAPTVIIVSVWNGAVHGVADGSAAIENILLAAEAMDIGSCWLGLISMAFKDDEITAKLDLPEDYVPLYGISLGYKSGGENFIVERNKNVVNWIK